MLLKAAEICSTLVHTRVVKDWAGKLGSYMFGES